MRKKSALLLFLLALLMRQAEAQTKVAPAWPGVPYKTARVFVYNLDNQLHERYHAWKDGKPNDSTQLKSAIDRALKNKPQKDSLEILVEQGKKQKQAERIALHTQEKIVVVDIKNIVRCEADVNYTCFYFNDKTKMMVTRTLKDFEEMLEDKGFARVHQSHLINTRCIKEFIKGDGGYLILHDGSNVPVSIRKRNYVMDLLNNL